MTNKIRTIVCFLKSIFVPDIVNKLWLYALKYAEAIFPMMIKAVLAAQADRVLGMRSKNSDNLTYARTVK
jgi:hypothetical protein